LRLSGLGLSPPISPSLAISPNREKPHQSQEMPGLVGHPDAAPKGSLRTRPNSRMHLRELHLTDRQRISGGPAIQAIFRQKSADLRRR